MLESVLWILVGAVYTLLGVRAGLCIYRQQLRETGDTGGVCLLGVIWPLCLLMAGISVIFGDMMVGFVRKDKNAQQS